MNLKNLRKNTLQRVNKIIKPTCGEYIVVNPVEDILAIFMLIFRRKTMKELDLGKEKISKIL